MAVDELAKLWEVPWWWPHRREALSGLISCLVHATLFVILAMMVEPLVIGTSGGTLTVSMDAPEPLDNLLGDSEWAAMDVAPDLTAGSPTEADRADETSDITLSEDGGVQATERSPEAIGFEAAEPDELLMSVDAPARGGLEGRNPQVRAGSLGRRGGTPGSETAVARGLNWLAAHQGRNGGWQFNLKNCGCNGYCRNPGTQATTTGATGLALLAFLGANHTHLEGEHREVVRKGLYYLGQRALVASEGVDLREGTMYGQGLAALALCEAYAMTEDPGLKDIAQQALDYIVHAQDRKGGGWRYSPGEPGDTTVTGWQLMALKSGRLGCLSVSSAPFYLAQRFLDSVQSDQGALYGYMDQTPRHATTAIGLLCRMYAGWRHEHPAISRGVGYLAKWGPSENDLYYDYYATQVMFHWGGSDWQRWNQKLREHLIRTQATDGHESGSWYFDGGYAQSAGRLYTTSMAILILEVYYRYMPLYGDGVFRQ